MHLSAIFYKTQPTNHVGCDVTKSVQKENVEYVSQDGAMFLTMYEAMNIFDLESTVHKIIKNPLAYV